MGSPVSSLSSSWSRCAHTRASLGGTHTWPLPLLDFSNIKVVAAFCGAAWSLAAAVLLWGCSWVPRAPGDPGSPPGLTALGAAREVFQSCGGTAGLQQVLLPGFLLGTEFRSSRNVSFSVFWWKVSKTSGFVQNQS